MSDSFGFLLALAGVWVTIGIVLSVVIGRRGHNSFGWLVMGVLLGPLAVVLAVDARRHDERLDPGKAILGSAASELARDSKIPVLLVGGHQTTARTVTRAGTPQDDHS